MAKGKGRITQVLPVKHEPVIPHASKFTSPSILEVEVVKRLPLLPKLPPLSLVVASPSPAAPKEVPAMAVTDTPPATSSKLTPERQALADIMKQLRVTMDRFAIESLSIVITSSPKPHVDIDVDYKKADKWGIDL